MKSAILTESKKPLMIADIELPESLEFGQVLVDLQYSGICGAQINEIDAVKGTDKFLPHIYPIHLKKHTVLQACSLQT